MFVRDLRHLALPLRPLNVVILVEKASHTQAVPDAAERQRTDAGSNLNCLLVVRLGLGVAFAVVVAGVDVAVTIRKVPVSGDRSIGRCDEPFALGEDRSLPAIAIDALGVIDLCQL